MNARSRLVMAILVVVVAGCSKKPETPDVTAKPVDIAACADPSKVQDPTERAALLRECARAGEFKPSSKRAW